MALISLNLEPPPRAEEHRSLAGYGDPLIAALAGLPVHSAVFSWGYRPAVLMACARRLEGVLAASDYDPVFSGLWPWIANCIIEEGEAVLFLDDSLTLRPVVDYELTGTASMLRYKTLTVEGPDRSEVHRNVRPEQVVHAVIRPSRTLPWRGENWRDCGIASRQLAVVDLAIELDAGSPRGTAIHATWNDNPEGLREKAQKLRELAGGISFLPLAGRSAMDGSGPYPLPVRLAPNDLDQLMKSHAALSGDLSESLGIPRALVGLGPNSTTTRPDALRSWVATTCGGWVRTLQPDFDKLSALRLGNV